MARQRYNEMINTMTIYHRDSILALLQQAVRRKRHLSHLHPHPPPPPHPPPNYIVPQNPLPHLHLSVSHYTLADSVDQNPIVIETG